MSRLIETGDQKVDSAIMERLLRLEAPLHPRVLAEISPEYALYVSVDPGQLVWVKPELASVLTKLGGDIDNLLVSLSGVPAGGKDTIRQWIETHRPGLTAKMITATTRPMRSGEVHKKDYFFLSEAEILAELEKDNLIGYSKQSTGHYGLPPESITHALSRARIAVSHIEISGWPKLAKAVAKMYPENPPFILSLFVLPQMSYRSYSEDWLPRFRPNIHQEKGIRAAWELSVAAGRTDVFIVNPIEGEPGELAAAATADFLASLLKD